MSEVDPPLTSDIGHADFGHLTLTLMKFFIILVAELNKVLNFITNT